MAGTSGWLDRRKKMLSKIDDSSIQSYRSADAELVSSVMNGFRPDSREKVPQSGMRVVCNISSAHIAAVLTGESRKDPKPYKNRYDLASQRKDPQAVGARVPTPQSLREKIDSVLASLTSTSDGKEFYYAAIELNGSGIRYFGDLCMVLKPEETDPNTLVLFKNSYDLSRSPIREEVFVNGSIDMAKAIDKAKELQGVWPDDVIEMAACKLLDGANPTERRITSGTVSAGVLFDEDYLEVIRLESFGASSLEEIRLSAQDVAVEGRVAERLRSGPAPSFAELQWRHRRRGAERIATQVRVSTRVVATAGRTR
ncbi:MAG: hypothetical protein ABSF28_10585 [Terracidiphilus sp.]|jgi:hypothetical protein